MLTAPILFSWFVYLAFYPVATISQFDVIRGILLCLPAFVMGLGILKKRSFGLKLVYLTLLYCLLDCLSGVVLRPNFTKFAVTRLLAWVICTVYYYRRKSEFT